MQPLLLQLLSVLMLSLCAFPLHRLLRVLVLPVHALQEQQEKLASDLHFLVPLQLLVHVVLSVLNILPLHFLLPMLCLCQAPWLEEQAEVQEPLFLRMQVQVLLLVLLPSVLPLMLAFLVPSPVHWGMQLLRCEAWELLGAHL